MTKAPPCQGLPHLLPYSQQTDSPEPPQPLLVCPWKSQRGGLIRPLWPSIHMPSEKQQGNIRKQVSKGSCFVLTPGTHPVVSLKSTVAFCAGFGFFGFFGIQVSAAPHPISHFSRQGLPGAFLFQDAFLVHSSLSPSPQSCDNSMLLSASTFFSVLYCTPFMA